MSIFTDHPHTVGETYGQHLCSACCFAGIMFIGSIVCFIHALLPFVFTGTGSRLIERLHHKMITARHTMWHPAGSQSQN